MPTTLNPITGQLDLVDNLQSATDRGATTTNPITAQSFITTGGASTDFVKGDGSLDSTTYLDTITAASTYVPKNDTLNFLSIDSNSRKLYAPNGTTVQLDYSLAGALSGAGAGAPVTDSIFLGTGAGVSSTSTGAVFIGQSAGEGTTLADYGFFLGAFAGYYADGATGAVFIGTSSGEEASSASYSSFIGNQSGGFATNAYSSVFIGDQSGFFASLARQAVFLGYQAGYQATNGRLSFFGGYQAGYQATNAQNSVFIGTLAGYLDKVDNITAGGTSVAIGVSSGTGGFSDSMTFGSYTKNSNVKQVNFGNMMFLDGIYNTTTESSVPVSGSTVTISSDTTNIGNVGSLGAEKLTNGTFSGSAASWTLGAGWTYASNTVKKSADGTGTLSQAVGSMVTQFVVGEMYYITFTTSNHTVGSFTPTVGGVTLPTINYKNRDQTFGYFFTATSNTALTFTPSNTSRFWLDNISIKKITGGKLNVAGATYTNSLKIMSPLATFTQTYSTATRTHANLTSADISAFTGGSVGFLDAAERDNLRTQINALRADLTNLKQVVNSLIDDSQSIGVTS